LFIKLTLNCENQIYKAAKMNDYGSKSTGKCSIIIVTLIMLTLVNKL